MADSWAGRSVIKKEQEKIEDKGGNLWVLSEQQCSL